MYRVKCIIWWYLWSCLCQIVDMFHSVWTSPRTWNSGTRSWVSLWHSNNVCCSWTPWRQVSYLIHFLFYYFCIIKLTSMYCLRNLFFDHSQKYYKIVFTATILGNLLSVCVVQGVAEALNMWDMPMDPIS